MNVGCVGGQGLHPPVDVGVLLRAHHASWTVSRMHRHLWSWRAIGGGVILPQSVQTLLVTAHMLESQSWLESARAIPFPPAILLERAPILDARWHEGGV